MKLAYPLTISEKHLKFIDHEETLRLAILDHAVGESEIQLTQFS